MCSTGCTVTNWLPVDMYNLPAPFYPAPVERNHHTLAAWWCMLPLYPCNRCVFSVTMLGLAESNKCLASSSRGVRKEYRILIHSLIHLFTRVFIYLFRMVMVKVTKGQNPPRTPNLRLQISILLQPFTNQLCNNHPIPIPPLALPLHFVCSHVR